MEYIILCIIAFLVCIACVLALVMWIGKAKKPKRSTMVLLTIGFSVVLICGLTFGYLNIYYHADETAEVTGSTVHVEKIDGGYFFDGPGTDSALIFYPGAKVEARAYSPLMTLLAEQGVDCFLAEMPFQMAFFGSKIADRFLKNYSYDNWAAAGHSMGGVVISDYAAEHVDQIHSLILLASYPCNEIPNDMRFCSIYGTKDGCLNLKAYEEAKIYWPTTACEHILVGGNHSQCANYGVQSGDLEAEITREEQQRLTADFILEAILNP